MKYITILFCCLFGNATFSQQRPVGIFSDFSDVGNPKKTGSTLYDEPTQTYTLKGAGYNIWFARDEFQYAYKKLKGDFILTANFEFVGNGVDPHRKIGWMVRQSLDDNAAHVSAVAHGDGLTVLQWRPIKGAAMRDPEDEIFAPEKWYTTIQVERSGKKIMMRAAHKGEALQIIGSTEAVDFPEEVLAGLFICSHHAGVIEEAKISNVKMK